MMGGKIEEEGGETEREGEGEKGRRKNLERGGKRRKGRRKAERLAASCGPQSQWIHLEYTPNQRLREHGKREGKMVRARGAGSLQWDPVS